MDRVLLKESRHTPGEDGRTSTAVERNIGASRLGGKMFLQACYCKGELQSAFHGVLRARVPGPYVQRRERAREVLPWHRSARVSAGARGQDPRGRGGRSDPQAAIGVEWRLT